MAALAGDSRVPAGRVQVDVASRRVTLTGTVSWQFQRRAAEELARRAQGVMSVLNEIVIEQPPVSAIEVQDKIERALVRSATIDADKIKIKVAGGQVTLNGTVRSWAEREEAEAAAWRATGVTWVINDVDVRTT
jgi:osmotically-inducible protein OsmY